MGNQQIEYCLLAINWWPTCMSKAEWSGWMQAIGALLALGIAVWYPRHVQKLQDRNAVAHTLVGVRFLILEISIALETRKRKLEENRKLLPAVSSEVAVSPEVLSDWLQRLRAVDTLLVPERVRIKILQSRRAVTDAIRLLATPGEIQDDIPELEKVQASLGSVQPDLRQIARDYGATKDMVG